MNKLSIQTTITNENINLSQDDKSNLNTFKKHNNNEVILMTFEKYDIRNRSLLQNRYFHGPLINSYVQFTGDTNEEYWKHFLKDKFLRIYRLDGSHYLRETRSLTVPEMREFIEKCVNFLIDQGGQIDADEYRSFMETGKDNGLQMR